MGGTARVTATGLLAGVVGTAALSVFERVEAAILAHRLPVYAAANVGGGLARRWLAGVMLPPADVRFGYLLRWLYGPSLGALFMYLRGRLPRTPLAAGLCFGAGVFAFEVAVMPAVAATPPIRTWSRAERSLMFLHTAVFGVATALEGELAFQGVEHGLDPLPHGPAKPLSHLWPRFNQSGCGCCRQSWPSSSPGGGIMKAALRKLSNATL